MKFLWRAVVRSEHRRGNEVGEETIARDRVMAAIVDVHRRAFVVEDVDRVQATRLQHLLEIGIAALRADLEW